MLVLSRKRGESVVLRMGNEIVYITVQEIRGGPGNDSVRLSFEAPRSVEINRGEVDRTKHPSEYAR